MSRLKSDSHYLKQLDDIGKWYVDKHNLSGEDLRILTHICRRYFRKNGKELDQYLEMGYLIYGLSRIMVDHRNSPSPKLINLIEDKLEKHRLGKLPLYRKLNPRK